MSTENGHSLETLWTRFAGDLRRYFRRRVDENAAEDLLQDTFVKLIRGAHSLRHEERLAAWVQRVAHNVLVDHQRERHVQTGELDALAPETEQSASRELSGCLSSFVRALPDRYREAATLVELEGLPREEAARRLELSASGLKSRIQRGREQLRAMVLKCCEVEFDRCGGLAAYRKRRPRDNGRSC